MDVRKRRQAYIILSILFTIVIAIGFSYAYFVNTINNDALTNVIVEFDGDSGVEFKTTSSTNAVSIVPDELKMFQSSYDQIAAVRSSYIDVQITALNQTGYVCTFDFVWIWNSGDQYRASSEGVKELTISSEYGEKQVPNYGGSMIIGSSSISTYGSVVEQKHYNFDLKYYNLASVDQSGHSGKSYSGSVKVDNVVCKRTLSGAVVGLLNKGEHISSQDNSVYKVEHEIFNGPTAESQYTKVTDYGTDPIKMTYYFDYLENANARDGVFTKASDGTWSIDHSREPQNNTRKHYSIYLPIMDTAVYELCYNISAGTGGIYAFKSDNFDNVNEVQLFYHAVINKQQSECAFLGELSASEVIRVLYLVPHAKATPDVEFYLQKTSDSTQYDAGIRYEGKNPDNYVEFNDEEWRIIGAFDGSTIGLEPGKKYTKIVRSQMIGTLAWDSNDNTDWANSSLNETLNNIYLNGNGQTFIGGDDEEIKSLLSNSKDMIAQYNGNYSTWYLRGTTEYSNGRGFYVFERATGVPGNRNGGGYADATTQSAVALLSPSDLGFAAYGEECGNLTTLYTAGQTAIVSDYNLPRYNCKDFNWLAQQWFTLLTYSPNYFDNYYSLSKEAGLYGEINPVVYLDSDAYLTAGTGTKDDPYKIAKPEEIQKTLSSTVLSLEQDDEYISSQDSSKYVVKHEEVLHEGITYDAGVRYEGKDPDNYVQFNGNEEWRIIGVFEGSTIGLEPGKQYTKIISNTSVGYLYWDDSSDGTVSNSWMEASLNKYLNGTYLNSLVDKTKVATYNGKYSTWYLRGPDEGAFYENDLNSENFYLYERISGETTSPSASATGAIGLIYPSDYGYAAYGSGCTTGTHLNLYGSGCGPVDWLRPHPGNSYIEFMITTNPSYINGIYGILNQDGSYVDWNFNGQTMVRPTLYLEYDVKVVDGNGSKANPYILEETPKTISDEVISKENDSNYTSSQDGSIYKVSYQNGYRYAGKDPDNYVTFNGESAGWRIIGTFNGDEIGLNGGEYYTKIVRAESIGQMPYDCDDHNGDGECSSAGESECDWENATLQRYLNGNYLNSITKSNMIATEALWHLKGGTPDDKNAPDWYLTERFSGVPGYRDGEEESAAETFRGAIGLMYPSDVGYSMYSTTCDNSVVGTYSTEFIQCEEDYCTGCANDTWLFNVANGYNDFSFTEWLLTPFYGDRVIASFGSMGIEFDVETFWPEVEVRPTLYLKSDVKITGGTGKKTDPYILNY